MKAVVQHRYGPPDVLRVEEREAPAAGGEHDVVLRVRAAGVDAGVWHLTAGKPYFVRLFGFGLRAPKQQIPGRDVAGVVLEVGTAVTRFAPGDEVFGTTLEGSFAEFARTTEDRLVHKPVNISFEQAAAVPVSACTALHAVQDAGRVKAGERVLVLGAGGGVGSFAVQIAVALGATVTGVCSTGKVDFVRSLGAERVIDREQENFAEQEERYDVIIDTAGNSPLSRLRGVLRRYGTVVIVGGEGGGSLLGGFGRSLLAPLVSVLVRERLIALVSEEDQPALETLRDMLAEGRITPAIDRVFPLEEAAAAIEYLHTGNPRGKVVVAA